MSSTRWRDPRRWPLRARVVVVALCAEALILAGLGAFLHVRMESAMVSSLDSGLAARAAQLAGTGAGAGVADAGDLAAPAGGAPSGLAQVIDASGRVVQSAGASGADRPLLTAAELRLGRAGVVHRTTVVAGLGRTRLLAAPAENGRSVVVVGSSLAEVDRATHDLLVLLVAGGLGALAVGGLAAWWLAGRALRPIDRLSAGAAAIGADDLDQRVEVPRTGDEVARLADVLNGLLARAERAVSEQRSFLADASHELRSPLAVLRTELDVALRAPPGAAPPHGLLESLREETGRLTQLTDNLLVLARADGGRLELASEALGLEEPAERAMRLLGGDAARKGVEVAARLDPAPVWGDRDRLAQVAINLLGNAIRHAAPRGRVHVATCVEEGEARLAVEDDGPGVPAELAPVIFERFTRADRARSRPDGAGGAGLGLAIAQAIATAHGGRIELERPGPGGTRFALRLPASPARPAPRQPGAGLP